MFTNYQIILIQAHILLFMLLALILAAEEYFNGDEPKNKNKDEDKDKDSNLINLLISLFKIKFNKKNILKIK